MSSVEGANRVSKDQNESISVVKAIEQVIERNHSLHLDLMTLQIVAQNRESESKEAREFSEFKIERLETLLQKECTASSRAKHDLQRLNEKMGHLNIQVGELEVQLTQVCALFDMFRLMLTYLESKAQSRCRQSAREVARRECCPASESQCST